jgi:hypothetical protein
MQVKTSDTWRKRAVVAGLAAMTAVVAALTFVSTGKTVVGLSVVASGFVRDADGLPVKDASVALYDDQPTDDVLDESPIARTTSADDGSYRFVILPKASLTAEAAANGGYNTFYVEATTTDGRGPYFIVISRSYASGQWVNIDGANVDDPSSLTRDDLLPIADLFHGVGFWCVEIRKQLVGKDQARTVIAETHTVADMHEDVTYGTTADSDIDIAASYDLGSSWSISGSVHVGNETGAAIKWSVNPEDGHEWTSNFIYRKYVHTDLCGHTWITVEPSKWTGGGAWPGADDSYLDHHCLDWYSSTTQNYGPGQEFTRSSKRLKKFGFAVHVFGVSLGARSGASRYLVEHWKMGTAQQNHFLCGNNAQPASAKRILAGA